MSDSILTSTKKALDVPEDYDVFDGSIILHINSVFSTLNQLGIGPTEGYQIEDAGPTWTEYLKGNTRLNFVKTYMYLRVRLIFDPPTTSFLADSFKEQLTELEYRIRLERETNSTVILGEHQKITGNQGDESNITLTNPDGSTVINATGTYSASFESRDGSRNYDVFLDASRKAEGILILPVTIKDGTYTVRRATPRRTILTIDVSAW